MAITRPVTDYKRSVKVATTTDISLSGGAPNSVDGVSLSLNDGVLVKAQTDPAQNGIYTVTTLGSGANGTWTRRTDFNQSSHVTTGTLIFVEGGTVTGNCYYCLMGGLGTVTLGTTHLYFSNLYGYISDEIGPGIISTYGSSNTGNLAASNVNVTNTIYAPSFKYSNGAPYIPYTNANVAGYLLTNSGNISAGYITGTSVTASSIIGTLTGPHNGTVGAVTPNTGAFTTLTATGTVNFAGTLTAATLNALNVGNSGSTFTGNAVNVSYTVTTNANIQTANVSGNLYAGNLITTGGLFWANGTAFSSGGGASLSAITQVPNANISANTTIGSGFNALSIGPLTIQPNVQVVVPAGQRWIIM